MITNLSPAQQNRLLRRGVAEIITEAELVARLREGKPLRLKQGFDPSKPDIHLGHVVGLRKLRQFQKLGHQVILIVGDWTARIGDPSGQSATRTMLSEAEVLANAKTYMEQFFKVVDKNKTEVRWQSDWFGKFTLADVLKLTSRFTVAQFLAREDFAKRYQAGRPIAITELLYPLMQAYDSRMIQADVEFGGTDQKFNCLVGRELQGMEGQRPQQVFLVPILVGTDGTRKMSKSLGNYIGVTDPPNDMYGKVMSLPDWGAEQPERVEEFLFKASLAGGPTSQPVGPAVNMILRYFELLTDVPDEELDDFRRQLDKERVNPMLLKKRLARDIVSQFHGRSAAEGAEERFEREVQRGEVPGEIPELKVSFSEFRIKALERSKRFADKSIRVYPSDEPVILNVFVVEDVAKTEVVEVHLSSTLALLKLVPSVSQAKQLIQQDAIEINDEKCAENGIIKSGDVIRIGKRRFVRIVNVDVQQTY